MNAVGSSYAQMAPASRNRPAHEAQLPAARYERLFIVTYGRSGSTLLQGVLNALPGYLIRGENWDLLGEAQKFFESVPRHRERQTGPDAKLRASTPEMPHYGFERFRDDTYAVALRRFFDTMLVNDEAWAGLRCVGFKEIHYTPEDVAAKVDFLRMIYPGCAIVYNTRNPASVSASEFQKNKSEAYFQDFNNLLADLARYDPNAVLVRYEDVVSGANTLPQLFQFLEEPFDARAFTNVKAFAAVLGKKHSYHSVKKGSLHSNAGQVQVSSTLNGFDLFVVDRMEAKGALTRIDGFMAPSEGIAARRFAKLLDGDGRTVAFQAEYDLPSPKIARKLGTETAQKARFSLRFKRRSTDELKLFFEDEELALTIAADRSL